MLGEDRHVPTPRLLSPLGSKDDASAVCIRGESDPAMGRAGGRRRATLARSVTESAGPNAASAAFPAGFQAGRFTAGRRTVLFLVPRLMRAASPQAVLSLGRRDAGRYARAMQKRVETRYGDEQGGIPLADQSYKGWPICPAAPGKPREPGSQTDVAPLTAERCVRGRILLLHE